MSIFGDTNIGTITFSRSNQLIKSFQTNQIDANPTTNRYYQNQDQQNDNNHPPQLINLSRVYPDPQRTSVKQNKNIVINCSFKENENGYNLGSKRQSAKKLGNQEIPRLNKSQYKIIQILKQKFCLKLHNLINYLLQIKQYKICKINSQQVYNLFQSLKSFPSHVNVLKFIFELSLTNWLQFLLYVLKDKQQKYCILEPQTQFKYVINLIQKQIDKVQELYMQSFNINADKLFSESLQKNIKKINKFNICKKISFQTIQPIQLINQSAIKCQQIQIDNVEHIRIDQEITSNLQLSKNAQILMMNQKSINSIHSKSQLYIQQKSQNSIQQRSQHTIQQRDQNSIQQRSQNSIQQKCQNSIKQKCQNCIEQKSQHNVKQNIIKNDCKHIVLYDPENILGQGAEQIVLQGVTNKKVKNKSQLHNDPQLVSCEQQSYIKIQTRKVIQSKDPK